MTKFIRSAAVLTVRDVRISEAFYREKLGFPPGRFWGEPPCFCITGRGRVTLFLDQLRQAGQIPVNQYWATYIYVEGVDAYAEEVRDRGCAILRGPEDMDHGCREFDVRDPDGHIIAFGQDLDPGDMGPGL
jgi:predicted enzyme related to lactoylglutathione lyase